MIGSWWGAVVGAAAALLLTWIAHQPAELDQVAVGRGDRSGSRYRC